MPDALIHLDGRLGNPPEMRFSQAGLAICTASVACGRSRKDDQTGQWENLSNTWYRVTWFGPLAEAIGQMDLAKGQGVIVDGSYEVKTYTTKDGTEGVEHAVTATGIRAFPKRDQSQGGGYQQSQSAGSYGNNQASPPPQSGGDPRAGGGNQGGYDDPIFR